MTQQAQPMILVDWTRHLNKTLKAKVLYSALAYPPHKDEIDANLVAIELPSEHFIDVEWVRRSQRYIVRLYTDDIDTSLMVRYCETAPDVIDEVIKLATRHFLLNKLNDDPNRLSVPLPSGRTMRVSFGRKEDVGKLTTTNDSTIVAHYRGPRFEVVSRAFALIDNDSPITTPSISMTPVIPNTVLQWTVLQVGKTSKTVQKKSQQHVKQYA